MNNSHIAELVLHASEKAAPRGLATYPELLESYRVFIALSFAVVILAPLIFTRFKPGLLDESKTIAGIDGAIEMVFAFWFAFASFFASVIFSVRFQELFLKAARPKVDSAGQHLLIGVMAFAAAGLVAATLAKLLICLPRPRLLLRLGARRGWVSPEVANPILQGDAERARRDRQWLIFWREPQPVRRP